MSVKSYFKIQAPYEPSGDQPKAITKLTEGIKNDKNIQILLGVTGSGKTFTVANTIMRLQTPCLILAPNKTLAAQLYNEMKSFFPYNAVEYFVSYYDYYQPEAFVPSSNTYIEKDARINDQIEQLRLKATRSVLERTDTIIVSTVSAIYGLGDPENYQSMKMTLNKNTSYIMREIMQQLVNMQYRRNDIAFDRGQYRVKGDIIDVFPSDEENSAIRLAFFANELEAIQQFDPMTGELQQELDSYTLYPKTHYVGHEGRLKEIIENIEADLKKEYDIFIKENKLVEAQRLKNRVELDIEMFQEVGYCQGVENYSRYLSGREANDRPSTLIDYLPKGSLIIADESHVMLPQIKAMYHGDRSRKQNLVTYGFRLSSALDNRPLTFTEFEQLPYLRIYVSATPGAYEKSNSSDPVELIVRPTGLLDPIIEIRDQSKQVEDVLSEIKIRTKNQERVLITTLTQKMAEHLSEFLAEKGIKVKYIHSKVETIERSEILRDLRLGAIDVVVGINLLREGLDLPEVSLVAIFDADKEGFLRSTSSLIQTVGRAARNLNGKAIMYASKITKSMQEAIDETNRRRQIQHDYNIKNHITPSSIQRAIHDGLMIDNKVLHKNDRNIKLDAIPAKIKDLEDAMHKAAKNLDFENAKKYRDEIHILKEQLLIS